MRRKPVSNRSARSMVTKRSGRASAANFRVGQRGGIRL